MPNIFGSCSAVNLGQHSRVAESESAYDSAEHTYRDMCAIDMPSFHDDS
jgi:hypothetical protein